MIHVCAPPPTGYKAQMRDIGCKKWRTVGEFASEIEAAIAMTTEFHKWKYAKRGRVIATFEWYDSSICMELKR